ncbi:MAG: GH3 auxin-responsive promoter family protein [Zavarzinella sp.]
MFWDLVVGNRLARTVADAGLVQYARKRVRTLDSMDVNQIQEDTLFRLFRTARHTQFGIDHQFSHIRTVEEYQKLVPVRTYEDFWKNYWQHHYPNTAGATWPENPPYYALSSGTTSGATKYIPITKEMLASNRKTAFTTVSFFRNAFPQKKLFSGKFFFLAGNTNLRTETNNSRAGDLSAIAAIEVPSLTQPYTFPPMELSGIADWTVKVNKLAEAAAKLPITAISGVPSWILLLFDRLKQITGKNKIADIWPQLQLIIHGGIKFDPYRELFENEIGPDTEFCEVYPCSEGFVATEDPRYKKLRIIPDHQIFFEFIPLDQFQDGQLANPFPVRHTLATAEVGVPYAVALTTCAGLWSYLVGDTIEFESISPPLIRFTGRTKYFLSAFGEHLISEELEKAVASAAHATHSNVFQFHVGPVFPDNPKQPGHHLYLVEFGQLPASIDEFISLLDKELCHLNEDYDAHRQNDLSMLPPQILVVKPGAFLRWMLANGKGSVQHKVPRMDNSGKQTASIKNWMLENQEMISFS